MSSIYITTDSASQTISAASADEAARKFAEGEGAPGWVKTMAGLEKWLRSVGGYGSAEDSDTGETFFSIPS